MKRRYGDVRTSLILSDKAKTYYTGTDPMDIYEYEDDDGYSYTYSIAREPESRRMSGEELNAALELMYDQEWAVDIIDEDSFGDEIPNNWQEIADYLNGQIKERLIMRDRDAIDALWEAYWRGELDGAPKALTE